MCSLQDIKDNRAEAQAVEHVVMHHKSHKHAFAHPHNVYRARAGAFGGWVEGLA